MSQPDDPATDRDREARRRAIGATEGRDLAARAIPPSYGSPTNPTRSFTEELIDSSISGASRRRPAPNPEEAGS